MWGENFERLDEPSQSGGRPASTAEDQVLAEITQPGSVPNQGR